MSPSYLRKRTQENRERLARLHAECLHRALERHIAYIEMYAPVEAKQGKTYVVSDNIRYSMIYSPDKTIPAKYVRKWLTKQLKAYFTKRGFTCKRHGDNVIVSWRRVRKEKSQG